jgi:hypothetical protein
MHTRYLPLMLLMLVIAGCERGAPSSPSSIATSRLGDASGHQHHNPAGMFANFNPTVPQC